MSKTPFMPLWVGDFLAKTQDLDAKEVGAYMLLLMSMWTRDGRLPNDSKKLQRVARVGRDWPKVWASIERYFDVDGDTITNDRLLQELHKVDTKRAVNAQAGSLGGKAKALKYKEWGLANATHSLKQPYPYPYKEEDSDFFESKKEQLKKMMESTHPGVQAVAMRFIKENGLSEDLTEKGTKQ